MCLQDVKDADTAFDRLELGVGSGRSERQGVRSYGGSGRGLLHGYHLHSCHPRHHPGSHHPTWGPLPAGRTEDGDQNYRRARLLPGPTQVSSSSRG